MTTATRTDHIAYVGGTTTVRRSRRRRYCQSRNDYPFPCLRIIEPGQRYVRSVMFPSHDASGYDVPVASVTCLACATAYDPSCTLATVEDYAAGKVDP